MWHSLHAEPTVQHHTRALTDGDALGVDGAQVAVLKQVHHEVLSGLTQQQQQQRGRRRAMRWCAR
jgi:hypothetical protein